MGILLTNEEVNNAVDGAMESRSKDPLQYSPSMAIAKAQLNKVAKWLRELPTDGHDKWYWYHQDLAEDLLKEE